MSQMRATAAIVLILGVFVGTATIGAGQKHDQASKPESESVLFERHKPLLTQPTPFGAILALDPKESRLTGSQLPMMATAGIAVTEGKGDIHEFVLTVEAQDSAGKVKAAGQTFAKLEVGTSKAITAGGAINTTELKPGVWIIRARLELLKPDGKRVELAAKTSKVAFE